jgi:uncharacterized protein DUF5648
MTWGTALVFMTFVAAASSVDAQNPARGQTLYGQLGCDASNCHGSNPAQNIRNVLNGAGSPATIEFAVVIRPEMNSLLTAFANDASVADDLAAYLKTIEQGPPPPPPPPPTGVVVEYFHAAFGHYFITNLATEITALDGGTFAGWARTGRIFHAYIASNGIVVPVCRFFTVAFPPTSSHFYTPFAGECQGLKSGQDWQYEGETFFVDVPDANGVCAGTAQPIYRLYNNGLGGAPNHRYATDPAVRAEMLAKGWISEGLGPLGVIFCVPA